MHTMIDLTEAKRILKAFAMLYRMKRDTVRPQDRVDAQRLLELFHLKEI